MDATAPGHGAEGRTAIWSSDCSYPAERDGRGVRPRDDVPSPEDTDELLALAAQELRTPQAVIASAADTLAFVLAQEDFDRADVARIADVIRRHSYLSRRLVARLSLTHEIGRGTVELETEQVQPAADAGSEFVLELPVDAT